VTVLQPKGRFHQVRRLTEVARALTYAATQDQVIDLTVKEAAGLLGAEHVVLLLARRGGGLSIDASPAFRLRAQRALRGEFDVLDEEVIGWLRGLLAEGGARFLAVPLVIAGEVAGVLAMAAPEDPERSEEEEEWLLSAVADQAAVSLEKLRLNEAAAAAEKARREREEQFQSLYDSPLIGLAFKSFDGEILEMNDAFLALAGYSREEATAGQGEGRAHRPLPRRWDALIARAMPADGSKIRPYESELVRSDGQRVDVLVGMARLQEQGHDLAFVVDISAQKRAEGSLRLLSETSKALLGSLDHVALFKSIAWLVVPRFADWCAVECVEEGSTNGQHVALENLSSSSVEHALEWRRRFPPDPKSRTGVAAVIRTGHSQLHRELPDAFLAEYACDPGHSSELRKAGLRSAILVPMLLHGKVVGVITFVRAGNRRRYTAEDLLLAEEIGRRGASAVENARLYHHAQEAISLRDDFLSVAAHELKTPLTTLQLQLDSLRAFVERSCPGDEKASRRMTSAARQMHRLTRLVESLLDVSRISAGRMMLNREIVDLGALVRSVLGQFELQARGSGTPIVTELPAEAVLGNWDRERIEQALVNVLSNALKYGPGKPVRISLEPLDGVARLSVKDEGIGIAPRDADRIFGRFERAVSTRNYGGLGLGLFITRQIVEAHGGDVRVISRPGEGAEFIVRLPALAAADARSTVPGALS